ncbi:MAG TPA: hypothetical protein DD729_10055 [Rhodobacteraceae bacterium]|jgi:hypothetical protein|nr:hypothetical protein [Paracoccaceae bacterium]
MNMANAKVHGIRPDPKGRAMLGNVSFYLGASQSTERIVANYECSCPIPTAATSAERISQIKTGLKNDALQQIRRLRAGKKNKLNLLLVPAANKSAA